MSATLCLHVEPHNYTLLDIEDLNSTSGQDATDNLDAGIYSGHGFTQCVEMYRKGLMFDA